MVDSDDEPASREEQGSDNDKVPVPTEPAHRGSRSVAPVVHVSQFGEDRDDQDRPVLDDYELPLVQRVLEFIAIDRCRVSPDGNLERLRKNDGPVGDYTWDEFVDRFVSYNPDVTPADAKRACRLVQRREKEIRRQQVAGRLLRPQTKPETAAAAGDWQSLASAFEMDVPELVISCFQHFFWQVLRKMLDLPVHWHIMIIILSEVQGIGKTDLLRKLLEPLGSLASKPVPLSMLVNPYSFRMLNDYYAIPSDDMEALTEAKWPLLKEIITSEAGERRLPGTAVHVPFKQRATLIGTSNLHPAELIKDPSGRRRFVGLPMRNADPLKGGDAALWPRLNRIDYENLWRSVDPRGPAPIEARRQQLLDYQNLDTSRRGLLDWLIKVDAEMLAGMGVVTRHGVGALALHERFCLETGSDMSVQEFGREMRRLVRDPRVPFGPRRHMSDRNYYPIRPTSREAPEV